LLGAWPAELTGVTELDLDAVRGFEERLAAAMLKSVREAKLHSNWASPNSTYEDAVLGFVRVALDISRPNAFLDAFRPFQERIARIGVRNSLVQTILKLTLPGMPDIYQGSELWDLSLVDPDNRRPVDYALRGRLLAEALASPEPGLGEGLLENWRDGRCKIAVTATLLAERRAHPVLFAEGGYEPLTVTGAKADHICAFARAHGDNALIVVTSRFPARLAIDPDWEGTEIAAPRNVHGVTRWLELLTGRVLECGEAFPVQKILGDLPAAVLVPADGRV
jgi:(1->4)-alpha-D-glucan 1-alpha-D-glucosylmutase